MTHPPRLTGESVLERWLGIEIRRMNSRVVKDRRPLSHLLAEPEPGAVTRGGDPYRFDPAVLRLLGDALPEDLRHRLRLPVLFTASPDIAGSCSCPDEAALAALIHLNEVSHLRTMQDGKFWLSRPLAYAIAGKYPTAFQVVAGI